MPVMAPAGTLAGRACSSESLRPDDRTRQQRLHCRQLRSSGRMGSAASANRARPARRRAEGKSTQAAKRDNRPLSEKRQERPGAAVDVEGEEGACSP